MLNKATEAWSDIAGLILSLCSQGICNPWHAESCNSHFWEGEISAFYVNVKAIMDSHLLNKNTGSMGSKSPPWA